MSEGEYGKFDFSGVHVDINKNSTENDVGATLLHELTHQQLASSTSIGMLDFLMMNIYEAEKDDKLRGKIKQLYNRLSGSSIKVQESTAVFNELSMLKSISDDDYRRVLRMYREGQTYIKKYGFEKLEFLLEEQNFGTHERTDKLRRLASNVMSIAIKAMNVDFYNENPLDGKYMKCLETNQSEYNANFRFMKIIKYIENEGMSIAHEMTDEEIDDIFRINMLPVNQVFDWKKFSQWANDMICKPLSIKEVREYVNYVEGIDVQKQMCGISAYNSCVTFRKRIINSVEEVKSSWTPDDILYIHFNNPGFLHILINLDNKVQSAFVNKYALTNMANVVKMLFMDRNHYQETISECPQLVEFDTFVDLGNVDTYAIEFMRDECLVDYYIKKVNSYFCIFFFRGDYNTVFFLMYPLAQAFTLINTYFLDLYLQADWWDDFISEEKMEYFCKYLTMKD